MATTKQIEANRRNAQHSTGPRTAAGKAVARANALKSGIYAKTLAIRGEDPADLEHLIGEYFAEWCPVTPRERDLVDSIVRNEWILRRMGLVEAELWNHYLQSSDATLPGSRFDVLDRRFLLAQGFIAIGGSLERLQRRISAVERSTRRARAELAEIRKQRDAEPEPAPQLTDTEAASLPIGFVPSIPESAPHPVSQIPDPEPRIPHPEPRIPNPVPRLELSCSA